MAKSRHVDAPGRNHGITAAEASETPYARLDDTSGEIQQFLLGYLDAVAAHPEMQRVRSAAFEIFAPSGGERLLDAGCGLGEVARHLGARVGAKGSVAAVDRSAQAISVAQSRRDSSPVAYTVGEITDLDFPDGHFDGVRCERVLQHVPDPDAAIKELARVTRPGGRVCVIETDWSSPACAGFEYLDEVRDSIYPAGYDMAAGRAIRSRMVRVGLQETTAFPVTLRFMSPEDAAVVSVLFNRDRLRDRLPTELSDRFFTSAERSAARGDFLFTFTMWICLGRVALA
jgi:ubiquinone/menaquinone biosynthesis C-methylase UbiE